MTVLDGKELWIEHISQVPSVLNLKNASALNFRWVMRCDSANADFRDRVNETRRFIPVGMDMIVQLKGLQRGQPARFILPRRDFPTPALIYRRVLRVTPLKRYFYEILLLPYRSGLVAACMYRRVPGTYEPELEALHFERIFCWRDNFPAVGSGRGDPYGGLDE